MRDRLTTLPPSMHRRVECEWGILRSGEVPRSNGGRRSGSLDSSRGEGGGKSVSEVSANTCTLGIQTCTCTCLYTYMYMPHLKT